MYTYYFKESEMVYDVGLDIGTGSVGWVALDENGKLARAKGKNLVGVRLFDTAQTAADRRGFRTTRRRLSRRKWRLRLLDELFSAEINEIDSSFFQRLKYSYVHPKDEENKAHYYGGYLFPTEEETKKFHRSYPTIYHLRQELMAQPNKRFDIREIYLAIHHLVKYRGHFLSSQEKITIGSTYNPEDLANAIEVYADEKGLSWELNNPEQLTEIISGEAGYGLNKSMKADEALKLFEFDNNQDKVAIKTLLAGLTGNQIDFAKLFGKDISDKDEAKLWKLKLDDEALEEKSQTILSQLTDEEIELFHAVVQAYDGFVLIGLLNGADSVSAAMVQLYDQHREDRKLLKSLAQKAGLKHKRFSEIYEQLALATDEATIRNGISTARELVEESNLSKEVKEDTLRRLDENEFLPKQRTKANSVIPHQLHLAELQKILQNQGQYYPFLLDTFEKEDGQDNKIEELLRFRIPYYVGPLVTKKDVEHAGGDADNHWVERNEGFEKSRVTPWNFDKVFNRDKAARDFIERLTGNDTYLIGEKTLPQNSLRYQLFTVLNELNNVRVNGKKFDSKTKADLINDLFKARKTVSLSALKDYLKAQGKGDVTITGLADESKFNSSLSSYNDLKKTFDAEYLENEDNQETLEKIIEIQTVFEDSKIASRELSKLPLDDDQVKKLSQTHYTGWGRLSEKLLDSKIIDERGQKVSILDKLKSTSQNFMSIINNDKYGVQAWITEQNTGSSKLTFDEKVNELTTSPANKRGIKQSFAVLNDIKKAMKEEPRRVYLEFAREDQTSVRSVPRYNQLKEKYQSKSLSEEAKVLKKTLDGNKNKMSDDRYFLYFQQQGKDMYTGRPINFERLSQDYDIDHIIPQAFTKDDSLDNRVLVSRPENARKSDSFAYTDEVQKQDGSLWTSLLKSGFINRKKYERLTKAGKYLDGQKTGFIARQLVETRQIIKNVASLIEGEYENSKAVAIRSEITADMRLLVGIKKHREINSFHHAFDALLITAAGQYMQNRYPDRDSTNVYNEFDRYTNDYLKNLRQLSSRDEVRRLKSFGFVVGTMRKGNEDWSEENTSYLRKVMMFKNILTTKKTEKDRGPLNKETIFSPKSGKKLIPLNSKRSDTALYGGYSNVYSAYMTLVRANGKNLLIKIPISIANQIEVGNLKINDYIVNNPAIKKFEKILISKLPLGQLVNEDGNLIYLASNEYRHNAKQLWLSTTDADKIASISENSSDEELLEAYDILTSENVKNRFPFFKKDIDKLSQVRDEFLDSDKRIAVIQTILRGLQIDAAYQAPVKIISKKVSDWHKLQQSGGIKLSDNSEMIYQSATGIFETRVKISDLL